MNRLRRSNQYRNWKRIHDMTLGELFRTWLFVKRLEWKEKHIREVKARAHWLGRELPRNTREFFVEIFGVEFSWYLPPHKKI